MQPRIVCAAIRAEDNSVLVGIRHYSGDMYSQISARKDGEKFTNRSGDDQGFVDQKGKYYTRKEAWIIAKENEQIIRIVNAQKEVLYSEHLY